MSTFNFNFGNIFFNKAYNKSRSTWSMLKNDHDTNKSDRNIYFGSIFVDKEISYYGVLLIIFLNSYF